MFLKNDGSLWTCGYTYAGDKNYEFGDASESSSRTIPEKIMDNVVAIDSREVCYQALKEDGSLWAWGKEVIGYGSGSSELPVKILDDVNSMSTSYYASLAVKNDGSLWTWGRNNNGALGFIDTRSVPLPRNLTYGVMLSVVETSEKVSEPVKEATEVLTEITDEVDNKDTNSDISSENQTKWPFVVIALLVVIIGILVTMLKKK